MHTPAHGISIFVRFRARNSRDGGGEISGGMLQCAFSHGAGDLAAHCAFGMQQIGWHVESATLVIL
jgi:hypothetical protein